MFIFKKYIDIDIYRIAFILTGVFFLSFGVDFFGALKFTIMKGDVLIISIMMVSSNIIIYYLFLFLLGVPLKVLSSKKNMGLNLVDFK